MHPSPKDANGIKRRLLKSSEVKQFRESLQKKQGNICPVCQREFNTTNVKPTLDHDHDTYLIRGVLCQSCNGVEGRFKRILQRHGLKDVLPYADFLRRLADYIERDQIPVIHPMHRPKDRKLQKRSYLELVRTIESYNETASFPLKVPDYPKSGKLTAKLQKLYEKFGLIPRFYSNKKAK